MIARCARRFHDEAFDVVSSTDWVNYLNDCYRDIIGASPLWPFLHQTATDSLTFAPNVRGVNLPSNVFRVTSVYNDTDQYPMRAIEGDTQHIRLYPDQTLTGTPSRYRVFNNQIQVWPLPDHAVSLIVDYIVAPSDLGSTAPQTFFDAVGAAAGDITVTGIAVEDQLVSVVGIKDSDHSMHDFTSEFTITAASKINNTGGTATTGYHLVVSYLDATDTGANTPIFPAQWHNILIEGALVRASIDDEQPSQAALYQKAYDAMLIKMIADLCSGQQDRNPQIVDNWY